MNQQLRTYYDSTGRAPNDLMVIEWQGRRYIAGTVKMNHDWEAFKEMVRKERLEKK